MERKIKKITGYSQTNGEPCFFRYELERPPKPDGFSKSHELGFVHWRGGSAITVITELRHGLWVKTERLPEPKTMHECKIQYEANVGSGEQTLGNVNEVFYFAILPPEIVLKRTETERVQALAQWVSDLIKRESQEFQSKAATMERGRLEELPARLPHEASAIDHYKNQQEVARALLRKEWPLVSRAMDSLAKAKTDLEKETRRAELSLAYIADYTAITGNRPAIKAEEEATLWREDSLIRFMNEALSGPRGRVDKRDWQLVNGWIEKNYYRMSERQLERAFASDWGYKRAIKGNTLAKRARRMGLLFALKRGRPEKPNFLPPG